MSTMFLTMYSDWPTPTVSTKTRSYPAASHRITASLVVLGSGAVGLAKTEPHLVTPPRCPLEGLGRIKALGSMVSSGILVLSPSKLPPVVPLLGSTARTATLGGASCEDSEVSRPPTYGPGQ